MNWLKRILFLRRHIKKDDVVIQVGFSLDRLYSDVFPISWFAKKLIIVEPDPRSYFKLMKRKWMMKDNYEYVRAAINSDCIWLAPKAKHNSIRDGKFGMLTTNRSLDMLCSINIPNIIILTCNGAEYDCLLSGKNLLHKGIKFIIANANLEIEKLLLSYKYSLSFEKVGNQKLLVAEK